MELLQAITLLFFLGKILENEHLTRPKPNFCLFQPTFSLLRDEYNATYLINFNFCFKVRVLAVVFLPRISGSGPFGPHPHLLSLCFLFISLGWRIGWYLTFIKKKKKYRFSKSLISRWDRGDKGSLAVASQWIFQDSCNFGVAVRYVIPLVFFVGQSNDNVPNCRQTLVDFLAFFESLASGSCDS